MKFVDAQFYEFSREDHVPVDHLLRSIDRFVELGELRRELAAFYNTMGRPSIDPELMLRMLLVGYCSDLSPREAAEKLGIAEETARTVLKRVFSKTGVSRQSELVALLTKLVLR